MGTMTWGQTNHDKGQEIGWENFSNGDYESFDEDQIDGYVVTPKGKASHYKYVAPTENETDHSRRLKWGIRTTYFNPANGNWEIVPLDPNTGEPKAAPSIPLKTPIKALETP